MTTPAKQAPEIRVLVTGAAGSIGGMFWKSEHQTFALRLADLHTAKLADAPCDSRQLDVSDYPACLDACKDIDVVLHLAGMPHADADFHADLLQANIIGTYNIFQAAAQQGCKRVVFASSAQAVEAYPLDVQVSETMAPRARNMYGASKVFGEGVASAFAAQTGMAAIAVRIANVADFQPGQQHSPRDVAAFISERDVVHLLACCIRADVQGYHVVHGVSDNRYKRLSIDHTRTLLDYRPQDDGFALLGIAA
ncbi:NAD-dependent epimerase/dehydratase family protein [Janthinobacterium agaricidamnosum]|uniref:Short chain dehydrogenase family protein n=1 Tax=Janthinobacterium agaricidamnosum NBRC 102515 = DSM 9628 TaxID=1349767 RepID=W0V3C0_9BURK|nr:NAD(P)-dependent oxidoreductase [Janthinobacterium agaricidamnosum]CDG82085.1 short chain dehydrogenase family protein [Janthinobacterium agaricidamnosum NBRC 102515 = DSM 9628]